MRSEPGGGGGGGGGDTILRLGPLAHQAAWVALEAFLGRPLDLPPVA